MPYINKDDRKLVDDKINEISSTILRMRNRDFLSVAGILNYSITRICSKVMGNLNYGNIVIVTGLLENVKQEFYRRIASPYENEKITQNGDVEEYSVFEKKSQNIFFKESANPDSYLEKM